ncbi:aldose 1-epimerase family protein [Flavobacterium cellulosilyticum]|uniref:Aldose 1-epimerase family protein n=1 Tax=Flavobacterium cellulosilyticum TaxID=2541731 RepID=A0A4R5CI59_9FLAO|nr:aldose 1-epimerase family protein [Flavobacterium cellulosilyticum]TDD97983.1 aldose 1-epimerase family protein [Flavobacterium cellulosilyticum]
MTTKISNSNVTAQINHVGAELFSIKNKENKEFMWEGNPKFWGKHSPVLFPIVGTLKNNSYSYNGIDYQLARHGFARDMVFEVVQKNKNSVIFSLNSSEETRKTYPFEFELQIIYTLIENSLMVEYKVFNKGNTIMPFSIGAHPAFALDGNFEKYSLEFEKEENLEYFLLENDLIANKKKQLELKNKKINLNYQLFENDALIFKTLESNSITILENLKPFLKVTFEDFPSLGLWTKIDASFICIEPWFGYSDTNEHFGNLFEKEGIQVLSENDIFNSKFSIEIL